MSGHRWTCEGFAALLDTPAVFGALRFLLVGRQTRARRLLAQHLGERPGERVLDVCCGLGLFAGVVQGEYVGIDLNSRYLEAAARRHRADPRKSFHRMDALALDFPDRSFDRAICVAAIHHFSDTDARRLLAEIRRVTRERIVVIDADGTPRGLLRRALLAADRGEWMRTPAALEALAASVLSISHTVIFEVGLYPPFVLFECDVEPRLARSRAPDGVGRGSPS